MKIAAIIIGIDGWEKYTLPLIESIQKYEPSCDITAIDNHSTTPYPFNSNDISFARTNKMLCYSAAINSGKNLAELNGFRYDWYIVLSNDVLCTGPFAHILASLDGNAIVGPQLWQEHGLSWIYGYCVCISAKAWRDIGGWDENFIMSSWEDVDFSTSALEKGYALEEHNLPFKHLDQKQRFGLPGYAGSEGINRNYFMRKHGLCN